MKRNIIIFLAFGFLITLGCKKLPIGNAFLEKQPGVDVTKDTVFSTVEYAQRFLWNIYYYLPYGLVTGESGINSKMEMETVCDLTDFSNSRLGWGGVSGAYYGGTYTAASENGSNNTIYSIGREGAYTGMRKANLFLENIDHVPGIDPALSTQLKAEARLIIAVLYSELFMHYGGAPWISHAYQITENFSSIPRMTAQATCDSIVALCDKVLPDLPWQVDDPIAWEGRLTKASAMALKARVLLFNASPLFNSSAPYLDGAAAQQNLSWHGSYNPTLWKNAADAAHSLIVAVEANGFYKMVSSGVATHAAYRQDFQNGYYLRGIAQPEVLINTRKILNGATGYTFYNAAFSWGANSPTQEQVDIFPMANGKPITDITSGYNPAFPFYTAGGVPVRDPRLYETVTVNGDNWQGRPAELYIGGRERPSQGGLQAHTGYLVRKFMLDRSSNSSLGKQQQWPYIRLPEIYLIFAEADNEFNGGPSAEAYRCVNVVRSRVGLANLTPGLTQVQFRDAVITERACEFGMPEEQRWFDMVRWKRDDLFQRTLHGMNLTRNAGPPVTYTYTPFETIPNRYWKTHWSPKWYLSAFPMSEIQKKYGLVQNPGWE